MFIYPYSDTCATSDPILMHRSTPSRRNRVVGQSRTPGQRQHTLILCPRPEEIQLEVSGFSRGALDPPAFSASWQAPPFDACDTPSPWRVTLRESQIDSRGPTRLALQRGKPPRAKLMIVIKQMDVDTVRDHCT